MILNNSVNSCGCPDGKYNVSLQTCQGMKEIFIFLMLFQFFKKILKKHVTSNAKVVHQPM